MLLNILGNAVKFTDRGEVVLAVSLEATGPETVTLRFAVRDTGIGIAPEQREQIFLAFRYGYGAAIATALFVLIELCVLFFLWRMLRNESD